VAAHAWTAINQLRDEHVTHGNPVNWPGLKAALDFSCWTELLELDDYTTLAEIVSSQDHLRLAFWLGEVYNRYKAEWERLNKPTTMEEWISKSLSLSGAHE
jgi:hypothetical protein